jgi:hypothetical protein
MGKDAKVWKREPGAGRRAPREKFFDKGIEIGVSLSAVRVGMGRQVGSFTLS